jgi:hypothetical protein
MLVMQFHPLAHMKCPYCNSCIGRSKTILDNKLFIYCKLCLKVWHLVGNALQEVEPDLKNRVLKQLNLSIID